MRFTKGMGSLSFGDLRGGVTLVWTTGGFFDEDEDEDDEDEEELADELEDEEEELDDDEEDESVRVR